MLRLTAETGGLYIQKYLSPLYSKTSLICLELTVGVMPQTSLASRAPVNEWDRFTARLYGS